MVFFVVVVICFFGFLGFLKLFMHIQCEMDLSTVAFTLPENLSMADSGVGVIPGILMEF